MPSNILYKVKIKALKQQLEIIEKEFTNYKIFAGRMPNSCEDPDNGLMLIEYKLPIREARAINTGMEEYFRVYINDKCMVQGTLEFRHMFKKDLPYILDPKAAKFSLTP